MFTFKNFLKATPALINLIAIAIFIKCDLLLEASSFNPNIIFSNLIAAIFLIHLCYEFYLALKYKEAWAKTFTGLAIYDYLFCLTASVLCLNFYILIFAIPMLLLNYLVFLMRDFVAEETFDNLHFSFEGKVYSLDSLMEDQTKKSDSDKK